jgi:hypothetical protein
MKVSSKIFSEAGNSALSFCEAEFMSCKFNDKRLVRRFTEVTKNFY